MENLADHENSMGKFKKAEVMKPDSIPSKARRGRLDRHMKGKRQRRAKDQNQTSTIYGGIVRGGIKNQSSMT